MQTIEIVKNSRIVGSISFEHDEIVTKKLVVKRAREIPSIVREFYGFDIVKTIFIPGKMVHFLVRPSRG